MDRDDREAIASLFERLAEVEQQGVPRDPEAEALIRQQIAARPSAAYYLAQTVVVQQQALEAAQDRIADLEACAAGDRSLGSVFGGRARRQSVPPVRQEPDDRRQPWGGGGFLAGAAQTAMGVAGGIFLGNLLAGSLFGSSNAHAGEADASPDSNDTSGGDSYDGGGFDGGGGE